MKLLQQLNEQATELDDVRELIAAIKGAAPFFKARGGEEQWIYRGIDDDMYPQDGFVAIHQPRTDRQPLSSDILLHRALDRKFLEQFSIPYRSEGLFATADRAVARSYGKPVILLPQGNFQFCWSHRIDDAFSRFDLGEAFMYVRNEGKKTGQNMDAFPTMATVRGFIEFVKENEWARTFFDQWIDWAYENAEYSNKDLPTAINSGNEIMIKCENYAVLSSPNSIRDYYVSAAEHILGEALTFSETPTMKQFINAIVEKVVH